MSLSTYIVPKEINYIAVFLTFACNLKCSYCINRVGSLKPRRQTKPQEWVNGLSRFHLRPDLPLTLQGGEPTSYPGFYQLIKGLPARLPLDLLTNAQFDIERFKREVKPEKFGRSALYAPIRISYHRETMAMLDTLDRAIRLRDAGFKVGIWVVNTPENRSHNEMFMRICANHGIDCRWKEYLAPGHGNYRYPESTFSDKIRPCRCQTSEILIDPAGHLFRCHADLYANRNQIGHLLDKTLPDFLEVRFCDLYGACNPCDTKVKNNRFQQWGHSSVTITDVGEASSLATPHNLRAEIPPNTSVGGLVSS